jgi:hypothetical protein
MIENAFSSDVMPPSSPPSGPPIFFFFGSPLEPSIFFLPPDPFHLLFFNYGISQ